MLLKMIIWSTVLVAFSAFAGEFKNYEMYYANQLYQDAATIDLKADLKAHYPDLSLEDKSLARVELLAKSEDGSAELKFLIGDYESRSFQVDGLEEDFAGAGHYSRFLFENTDSAQGEWLLVSKGNIKIKKIIVGLESIASAPRDELSAECTYVLRSLWGRELERFRTLASGVDESDAVEKACAAALSECQVAQGTVSFSRCERI